MNPSDIETSDSTSSSSVGYSSSLREGAAVGSPPRQTHDESEPCGAVERARGVSVPSSGVRGAEESGESGHHARKSQGDTPGEEGGRDDENKRRIIKSPARSQNDRPFSRAWNRTGDENEVAQLSPGTNNSRQRPLSAPPKTYPFARHEELPEQNRGETDESGGLVIGARTGTSKSGRPYADPGGIKEESIKIGRDGTANDRCGRDRGSESSAGRQRLSMSSIFGVASERRTSDEKQTASTHSLLPDGRGKVTRNGAIGSGLPKGSKEGGEIVDAPLSSQEFGLHRWKEYAVLRHGRNRRFVNSPHGREILQETAAKIRAKEVEDLNRELKDMRALVEELHSALRAAQTEKSSLQARVIALEREVEGMDCVRRRWLREDASNRGRGSNLERRLAGNTGNLRTFLFGADAKLDTTKTTEEPSRSSMSRSKSPAGLGRTFGGGGGVSCAATSERSSAGEEEHGGAEWNAAVAERNAVRRARETAELERSELRRRHDVEMHAKQSRIEKFKLEIRKLEAERDGLKQAAESQAGLFKEGYTELRACLQEMKTHRPALLPTACGSTRSSSDASPAAEAEDHSWRGSRKKQEEADNGEGTQAWVETMLATEEGLNHQVRTLQSLLLEAVSAVAPTAPMPAAVTKAADAVREGMGLPPLGYSRRPPPLSHDVPHSSRSGRPDAANASVGPRSGDLELTGPDHPPESGGLERHCDTDERLGLSVQGEPSHNPRRRHHTHITSSGGQAVGGAKPRPTVQSRARIESNLARNSKWTSDDSSVRPIITRGTRDDDGYRSCTGSEGSGTMWVRILPTDETSSEEESVPASSPKSHPEEKTRGWRGRGRDEILRRYLGGVDGEDGGIDDGPNVASESGRRAWTILNQGSDPTQTDHPPSSSSAALVPTGAPLTT